MKLINSLLGAVLSHVHTFWEGMFLLIIVMVFILIVALILLKYLSKLKVKTIKVGPVELDTKESQDIKEIIKEEIKEAINELEITSTGHLKN